MRFIALSRAHKRALSRGHRPSLRRGMAVVMVLGLLAITFALAYAMMRSQVTNLQIQRNAGRAGNARAAAITGLHVAIRAIHSSNWAGVGSTLAANLDAQSSYLVTFETGDSRLQPASSDYAEYPYRVTVVSTGTSHHPGNLTELSTFKATAVMQLVRRKLTDEPPTWSEFQPYNVYHWGGGSGREAVLELPARINGTIKITNALQLCTDYPGDGPDQPFDGNIDEVAIFDRALSNTDIAELYTQSVDSLALSVAYAGKSPRHWWTLDDAAQSMLVEDKVGDQNGVPQGAVLGAAGPLVKAANQSPTFDGYNDHINLGSIDISGSAISILAWFRADDFETARARIVSKARNLSTEYWVLTTYRNADGTLRLRFRLRAGGEFTSLVATTGDLLTNSWMFAAAVYDGTQMKLYLNGALVGSQAKTGSLATDSQAPVFLGDSPPGSATARVLREYRTATSSDGQSLHPLPNQLSLPTESMGSETMSLLNDELGVITSNVAATTSQPAGHPGNVSTYRLYPGGKRYTVPVLPDWLNNTSLSPDPVENPLGVFRHEGYLQIDDNVSIEGTIIHSAQVGGIYVRGRNVEWSPVVIPALHGSTAVTQLPIAIVADDLDFQDDAQVTTTGLAMVWDSWRVQNRDDDFTLNVTGKVIAAEFEIRSHQDWDESSSWYQDQLIEFYRQTPRGAGQGIFLDWLHAHRNIPIIPNVSISPDSTNPAYHWHDWTQPIFVAHPDDEGLRWDILLWKEG